MPPVEDLLERYKLDAGVAFDIARPRLRAALREYDEKEAAELASSRKKQGLLAKLAREKGRVGESAEAIATIDTAPDEDIKMEEMKPANEAGTPPPPTGTKSAADSEDAVLLAVGADPSSTEEASISPSSPAPPSSVSVHVHGRPQQSIWLIQGSCSPGILASPAQSPAFSICCLLRRRPPSGACRAQTIQVHRTDRTRICMQGRLLRHVLAAYAL